MKKFLALGMIIAFLCYLKGSGLLAAEIMADIRAGDSVEDVVAKLGEPKGMIEQGRKLTYNYDLGMIDFENGRVIRVNLMTPEESERVKLERARAWEESQHQAAAEQRRLVAAGQAELQARLSDAQFAQRPPDERLAYWQEFTKKYPYTDVNPLIVKTAQEVEAQQIGKNHQKNIERVSSIVARLNQLDKDYATSLANWKRNEINAERSKLVAELTSLQIRIREYENQRLTNAVPAGGK